MKINTDPYGILQFLNYPILAETAHHTELKTVIVSFFY